MSQLDLAPRPEWELFRTARKRLGVSQTEMSQRVGVTQSKLSRWERNGHGLTQDVVSRISSLVEELLRQPREDQLNPRHCKSAHNGRACARIRNAMRLKQQQVADMAGISRTALSMFENGYCDLTSEDFTSLFRVLENQVQENGYEAMQGLARYRAHGPGPNGPARFRDLESFFAAAQDEGLRRLESRLESHGDPGLRLKIAEGQIAKHNESVRSVTDLYVTEKQKVAALETENLRHKKHKELLGNFVAAQQLLITAQTEMILALQGDPNRNLGKGVRLVPEIHADVVQARTKVEECHENIIAELERKTVASRDEGKP